MCQVCLHKDCGFPLPGLVFVSPFFNGLIACFFASSSTAPPPLSLSLAPIPRALGCLPCLQSICVPLCSILVLALFRGMLTPCPFSALMLQTQGCGSKSCSGSLPLSCSQDPSETEISRATIEKQLHYHLSGFGACWRECVGRVCSRASLPESTRNVR